MSKLQVTQPHSLSHRHAPHSITCPLRYREKAYHIWDLALEMLQHSTIHCVSHQVTVSSTKQCVADLHCCQPPWHWSLGPQALVTPSSTTTAAGPNCSGPYACTGPIWWIRMHTSCPADMYLVIHLAGPHLATLTHLSAHARWQLVMHRSEPEHRPTTTEHQDTCWLQHCITRHTITSQGI